MDLLYGLPKNLMQWAEDNKNQLSPPVCNAAVYPDGNYIINMVGGGNQRSDFHDNATEEIFYQLKGEAHLLVWDRDRYEHIYLREGDVFLQPPHLLHSPQRPHEGLCFLIEQKRPKDMVDGLQWQCAHCGTVIWRAEQHVNSLTEDLPAIYRQFYALDDTARTCTQCGTVHPGKDFGAWHTQLKDSRVLGDSIHD